MLRKAWQFAITKWSTCHSIHGSLLHDFESTTSLVIIHTLFNIHTLSCCLSCLFSYFTPWQYHTRLIVCKKKEEASAPFLKGTLLLFMYWVMADAIQIRVDHPLIPKNWPVCQVAWKCSFEMFFGSMRYVILYTDRLLLLIYGLCVKRGLSVKFGCVSLLNSALLISWGNRLVNETITCT